VGTPHLPSLKGAILVLEEVGEAPYRVDRMLTHLDLAGHLDGLAGVALGQFTTGDDVRQPTLSLDEVIADVFASRPYPVATNLAYGHCLPRHVVPWGVRAELSVTDAEASLRVSESAVAAPPGGV
jgi:muramoyltetrapeptide carboxypeptidase